MGAETTIYVKVIKEFSSWIKVAAVTRDEAVLIAASDPDIVRVLDARYEPPYSDEMEDCDEL